ncbi:MAG: hypothetical protein ACYTCU_08280 [Planctomycetota bacterium]|jgi:hypothetical protein
MRTLTTIVAALLLAAPTFAFGEINESFDGTNLGGWTYGPPEQFEPLNGNPGGWLHQLNVDTFAPQLRTTDPGSPFAGDYRARNVTNLGVDLATISTQFPAMRECTLMLSNGAQTVYWLGTEFVPQPGTGWKSFDFAIDAQSLTMPAGWTTQDGDPDTVWNAVITNVVQVTYFYGDPTFFYIFDQWNVGVDNARIETSGFFVDLGFALAGATGNPVLQMAGTLEPGDPFTMTLFNALANSTAVLFVGLAELNAPFKGGIMVPAVAAPFGLNITFATDGAGTFTLPTTWPTGLPSPLTTWYQFWILDPAGPVGVSASNAVKAFAP